MEESFWDRFVAYHARNGGLRRGRRAHETPVCAGTFTPGRTAEECDAVLERILDRRCTAIIAPLEEWQESGRPIPCGGDWRVVNDSRGHPRCVLRSERAVILPLREMTEELALREGADRSLAAWQNRTRPALLNRCAERGVSFSLDMLMVADLFSLAYFEDGEE